MGPKWTNHLPPAQDARKITRKKGKPFNLKWVFPMEKGQYLADIRVIISEANGEKLVEPVANGPWIYPNLKAGSYQVKAIYENKEKTRTIEVGRGTKGVMFHWEP